MTFTSINFLLFFPVLILIYYLCPVKFRYIFLLFSSHYFYFSWNPKYLFFLIPITLITYSLGLGITYVQKSQLSSNVQSNINKLLITIGIITTIGVLAILKYTDFFLLNINRIASAAGLSLEIPEKDLLLPVGISFYSFQSLGYLIDIYRRKVSAEKNLLKYSLFISFFPTILSGPIERAGNLLKQINQKQVFKVENIRYGLLSFLWGLYLKIVVADNLAVIVNDVIDNWSEQHGCVIALAIVLFGIQIYCDFNGYSQMALGVAKILDFDITVNFSAPYLAGSIKDFWRRWHISLTSWFTEYLYIPLGGNRKGTLRKYMNTLIVFGLSGLWHGAGLNFVVWGLLNGIYLILYGIYQKHRRPASSSSCSIGTKISKRVFTFLLVDFSWFFFAMPSLREAIRALQYLIYNFEVYRLFSLNVFKCFPTQSDLVVFLISMLLIIGIDWLTYCQKDFRSIIFMQPKWVRWVIYLFFLFAIIFWGAYGGNYEQKSFIYFDF